MHACHTLKGTNMHVFTTIVNGRNTPTVQHEPPPVPMPQYREPTHLLVEGVQPRKLVALCCNVEGLVEHLGTQGYLVGAQLVDHTTILNHTLSTN
jgi:hypothetical protein